MGDQVWKVRLGDRILYFMDSDRDAERAPLCANVDDRVNDINSYAHAYKGGPVMRYQQEIGRHEDLEFLELVEEPGWSDGS